MIASEDAEEMNDMSPENQNPRLTRILSNLADDPAVALLLADLLAIEPTNLDHNWQAPQVDRDLPIPAPAWPDAAVCPEVDKQRTLEALTYVSDMESKAAATASHAAGILFLLATAATRAFERLAIAKPEILAPFTETATFMPALFAEKASVLSHWRNLSREVRLGKRAAFRYSFLDTANELLAVSLYHFLRSHRSQFGLPRVMSNENAEIWLLAAETVLRDAVKPHVPRRGPLYEVGRIAEELARRRGMAAGTYPERNWVTSEIVDQIKVSLRRAASEIAE